MSTFELTWDESRNNAYTPSSTADQAQWLLYAIKTLLMAQTLVYKDYTNTTVASPLGAWTCYYSCNGTTAGTPNDGVDRWGATYTPANILFGSGSPASAHSWIVLKSPWGLYCLISYWGNGLYDCRICFSLTAPTGGSTTADPTMTNAFGHNLSGGYIGANVQHAMNNSGPVHITGWLARNGEAMISWSHDGDGKPWALLMMRQLTETHVGDNHNAHCYLEWQSTYWPISQFYTQVNIEAQGWQSRATNQQNTPTTVEVAESGVYPQNNSVAVLDDLPAVDPIDGAICDFPLRIYSTTLGYKSMRGRLQDFVPAPTNAGSNLVEPAGAGPYQSITFGSANNRLFWMPWHDPSQGLVL